MTESTTEIFEERVGIIQCPINRALAYIAENGEMNEDNKVYYLVREREKYSHAYSPDGWATQYQGTGKCNGRWIGIKEVIRVAYLYAIGETPNPRFGDDDLDTIGRPASDREGEPRVRLTTAKAKKILKRCKFLYEDRGNV